MELARWYVGGPGDRDEGEDDGDKSITHSLRVVHLIQICK